MNKETLAKAKNLEKDIQQMEFALSYYKQGQWSHWDINDCASSFHFEFCKNWSHSSAETQDLPTWLNGPLMEVVEREVERCKTELDNLGNEKPSAAECIAENMKQLGKAVNQMGVKASDLGNCTVQTPPKPIGYLEHEESKTRIPVFKRIGWFHRCMIRWCFGVKYTKGTGVCEEKSDDKMKAILRTEYEKGRADVIAEQTHTWSEEDENRFNNLKWLVEHSNEGNGTKEGFIKFIDRLKKRWKPSEEQIQALEYQVHSTYEGSWQYRASKELLEQLKKL